MKHLKPKQKTHLESRRKKAIARRKRLKVVQAEKNPPEPTPKRSAPRWLRRRKALQGTTYWRGDRFVLEGYRGR